MSFCKKHWKVFLSMTLSFITVFFIIPFFMTPGKLTRTVGNFTEFWTGQDLSLLTKYFTLNFESKLNCTGQACLTPTIINSSNLFTGVHQPIPTLIVPTEENIGEIPNGPIPRITRSPTRPIQQIQPTTYIKPTKPPKPSPTPLAPPGYLRPGTDLEDIFKKAGEYACVPPALLKAFVAQEAPGVLNWSTEQALFYNAYDWWHRVKDKNKICGGYGWYPETGKIPEDSLYAGESCKDPFSPETANDTYSKALGATQMLESYWEKYYKEKTKQKLKVSPVDRRVLIDSLVGFGIHLKEDTGYGGSCSGDWEMKYVAKAACVNAGGTCDYYNYCYTICNNYNKYAKKNYNCDGAAGLFVPGSYCQFK